MSQAPDRNDQDFQTKVLTGLQNITNEVENLKVKVAHLQDDVEKLDYKFDTYQKASDQVMRLATTIVVAAASVIILSPLLHKASPWLHCFDRKTDP